MGQVQTCINKIKGKDADKKKKNQQIILKIPNDFMNEFIQKEEQKKQKNQPTSLELKQAYEDIYTKVNEQKQLIHEIQEKENKASNQIQTSFASIFFNKDKLAQLQKKHKFEVNQQHILDERHHVDQFNKKNIHRVFNSDIYKQDQSLKDVLSFTFETFIRQKKCEPYQEFKTSYSYDEFCEDTSNNQDHIHLRAQYLIQDEDNEKTLNLDEFDMLQEHKVQEKKEQNNQNKEIYTEIWTGGSKAKPDSKYQIILTYFQEIPKNLLEFEKEYKWQKHLDSKLNSIKTAHILRVISSFYYKQKLFFDKCRYIHVKIQESAFISLSDVIKARQKKQLSQEEEEYLKDLDLMDAQKQKLKFDEQNQAKQYEEKHLFYFLRLVAKTLQEAKKNNIYHSNLNDKNIMLSAGETLTYKITGFELFTQDIQTKRFINDEIQRKKVLKEICGQQILTDPQYDTEEEKQIRKKSEKTEANNLLFFSPEMYRYYQYWVKEYTPQKEQEMIDKRFYRAKLIKDKNEKIKQLEDVNQQMTLSIQQYGKNQEKLDSEVKALNKEIADLNRWENHLDDDKFDINKSDVYSMGIILLEMMSLGLSQEQSLYTDIHKYYLYDEEKLAWKIDLDKAFFIKKSFAQFSQHVKKGKDLDPGQFPNLVYVVTKMLMTNPDDRPNFQQILDYIKQFDQFEEPDDRTLDLAKHKEPEQIRFFQPKDQLTKIQKVECLKNIYKLACVCVDIKNFNDAGLYFQKMLEILEKEEDLIEDLGIPFFIQTQFMHGYSKMMIREIDDAQNQFNEIITNLEQQVYNHLLEKTYYKVYYYIAYCHFLEGSYLTAKNYLNHLQESYSHVFEYDQQESLFMIYQLYGMMDSDMGNSEASQLNFLKIIELLKNQSNKEELTDLLKLLEADKNYSAAQYQKNMLEIIQFWSSKNTCPFIDEIKARFYLGVEYEKIGEYKIAQDLFKIVLTQIDLRSSVIDLYPFKLMSQGYLAKICVSFNLLREMGVNIQKSYDQLQSITKNEGENLDLILLWLHNFGHLCRAHITIRELHQLTQIIQIGLDQLARNIFKKLAHDKVFKFYVLGKSYYYFGDTTLAIQYFVDALQAYNEISKFVKQFSTKQEISNYQQKLQKYIYFKEQQMKGNKVSKKGVKSKFETQKYVGQIDQLMIAEIYDWLQFIYVSKIPFHDNNKGDMTKEERIKDCISNFINIYKIEFEGGRPLHLQYFSRLAKIYFANEKFNESLDLLNQATRLMERMSLEQLNPDYKIKYSNLLIWRALVQQMILQDTPAQATYEQNIQLFNIFLPKKQKFIGQNNTKEEKVPDYFIFNTYVHIGLNCICVGLYREAEQFLIEGYKRFIFEKKEFQSDQDKVFMYIDYTFLLGMTCTLAKNLIDANKYYTECMLICENLYNENTLIKKNSQRLSLVKEYLGRILLQMGYYSGANDQFNQSINIFKNQSKENDQKLDMGYKLANVASILCSMQKYSDAQFQIKLAKRNFKLHFFDAQDQIKNEQQWIQYTMIKIKKCEINLSKGGEDQKLACKQLVKVYKWIQTYEKGGKEENADIIQAKKVDANVYGLFCKVLLDYHLLLPNVINDEEKDLIKQDHNITRPQQSLAQQMQIKQQRISFLINASYEYYLLGGNKLQALLIVMKLAHLHFKSENLNKVKEITDSIIENSKNFDNLSIQAEALLLKARCEFHEKIDLSDGELNSIIDKITKAKKIFSEAYPSDYMKLQECFLFLECIQPILKNQVNPIEAERICTRLYVIINHQNKDISNYNSPETAFLKLWGGRAKLMKIQLYRTIKWIQRYTGGVWCVKELTDFKKNLATALSHLDTDELQDYVNFLSLANSIIGNDSFISDKLLGNYVSKFNRWKKLLKELTFIWDDHIHHGEIDESEKEIDLVHYRNQMPSSFIFNQNAIEDTKETLQIKILGKIEYLQSKNKDFDKKQNAANKKNHQKRQNKEGDDDDEVVEEEEEEAVSSESDQSKVSAAENNKTAAVKNLIEKGVFKEGIDDLREAQRFFIDKQITDHIYYFEVNRIFTEASKLYQDDQQQQ